MFKLEVVNSIEEFRNLKDEWDELLDNSFADNIFLTWEWQFNWWQHFNDNKYLHIILVRNETDKMLGIAPLYIKRKQLFGFIPYNELRFIGNGDGATSEYLDFICHKNEMCVVTEELLKYMYNGFKSWHTLVLSDLVEDSQTKKIIIEYLSQNKHSKILQEKLGFCPVIKISSDWNSYLQNLSSQMRRNLRRDRRKMENNFAVEYKKFDSIYDAKESFEMFQRLYAARRNKRKEENKYVQDNYKSFQENIIKSISEKKWLSLYLLYLNKKIVAVHYWFKYKQKLYGYQMGFDDTYAKFSVSQNLLSYVIENSIKEKVTEFDLLRGGEQYKMRWANDLKKKTSIIVSNSKLGNAYISFFNAKNGFLQLTKRLLPESIKEIIKDKIYK